MSNRLKIKLRSRFNGGHISQQVYMGDEDGTLQNAGQLKYGPHQDHQWLLFTGALVLANDTPLSAKLVVESEGDSDVIAALKGEQ
jgi:hypothetical protein